MNVIATMNVRHNYSTQSLIVMPGCTLEVWDKDSNPESKTIFNTVKKKQSQIVVQASQERSQASFCS